MKNNFISVIKFNYIQGLKSKWFIALLMTGIFVIGIGVNYEKIIDAFMKTEASLINVVDLTEERFFENQFDTTNFNIPDKVEYKLVDESSVNGIKQSIADGTVNVGALVVFTNDSPYATIYYGDEIDNTVLKTYVVNDVHQLSQLYNAKKLNLSESDIQSLFVEKSMLVEYIAKASSAAGYALLLIFLFVLYILIMLYGGILANAVVEEKSGRIIENLLCYCKPLALMFGKIAGYFLLAVTHIVIWILSALILLRIFPIGTSASEFVGEILSIKTVILFVFSLLSGFLMYASAYVAFASHADNSQDSSQLMLPMTIVLMISFFVGIFSLRHINSGLADALSYCPFLAPIVYFGDAIYNGTSVMNMIVHFGVQAIEVLLIAIIASNYYKNGVFKYGSNGIRFFLKKKR